MDPAAPVDAAQPDAPEAPAQGHDDYHGLYDLSTAPEELRPHLEAELKKITGNVDQRFREHAEQRKQWESFEQIEGLRDVPAEDLADLLQFREIASDPVKLEQWWEQVGNELGFFDADDANPDGGSGEGEAMPAWAQTLADRLEGLEQSVQPLREHVTTTEQQRAQAEADRKIQTDLSTLREQHGDFNEKHVLQLAQAYDTPDAVKRGFEDYLEITGQAQGELVDRKADQPAPGLNGGRPDTTPEKITSFAAARTAALARLG